MLCAAPASLAQDAPGPVAVASGADCQAYGSAESSWTDAEAWVRGRICAGVPADLDEFVACGLGAWRASCWLRG